MVTIKVLGLALHSYILNVSELYCAAFGRLAEANTAI